MNTLTDPQLEAARQALQKSLDIYATNQQTLFTHDGHKINAPSVHEREAARLLEPVTAAVDKAIAVADKVTQETEAQRLAPHADPTSQLSASDLADANLRRVFVAEDCETLPLDDLAQRLRAVHSGGSKPSQWLHDRYSKARWTVESDKVPQSPDLAMFAEVLRDLGVTGPKSGLSDEAQRRAEAAGALKRWAGAQLSIAQTGKKPSTGAKIAF